ncbi:MAG TPA: tetratricopeptide repeat protein, partial [Acidobacteriota bacterium]|nr:tetratricopeptide repeat protein [Acidobacteriota bacterium]
AAFLPLAASAGPRRRPAWSAAFVVVAAAMFLAAPPQLFRGLFQDAHPNADILYYKEGKVANILVYDFKKLGYKDFHLNAVNEASSRLWHVQLFKMLGLLPTLVHDNPSDALMVAFGAGMSAGACVRNVESLDCVDLNPDIAGVAAAYTRENLDVINQPNFRQIINDGRNALMLSPRKYSLIISDATNPKMLDSWTLYSREFYQLVKDRLKPDGVFCQWTLIPLPGESIKVILNTFRSVFPHMSFWAIYGSTQVLMLGTPERLAIDYDDLKRRLEPLFEDAGLAEFGVDSVEKFLSFFLLGEDGVARMLADYDRVSTDDLPYAQFHIDQDVAGIDNCLDLVRYQESIRDYMRPTSPPPPSFAETMTAYEDIARRLNIGFLTNNRLKYAEAAVVAADAGLDDANVAHMLNYCPEKKRHFQTRLATHPDDVTAHNWLGNIYLLAGEYEKAEKEFNATLALKPDHAFARINLAMTHLATREYDSAVAGFLAVRELSPTKRILQTVAHQLDKVRILRKLAYQPESAELVRDFGIAYYNEGNLLDAIRAYRRAAELSGDDQSILYNLALISESHEFVSDAARLYGELSAEFPGDPSLAAESTHFTVLSQDPARLREWLNTHIEPPETQRDSTSESGEKPEEHPPTCDQALAIWNDVDPDGAADPINLRRAAELYEQSTRAKPNDLHAYADAAVIFEALNDFDRAARIWRSAAQARPDLAVFSLNLRRLESLAELDRVQTDGVERAALLRQVAGHFRAINEPERALEYLRESVAMVPDRALVWLDLAETAAQAGLYGEAVAAADRALMLQPGLHGAAAIKDALGKMVDQSAG